MGAQPKTRCPGERRGASGQATTLAAPPPRAIWLLEKCLQLHDDGHVAHDLEPAGHEGRDGVELLPG